MSGRPIPPRRNTQNSGGANERYTNEEFSNVKAFNFMLNDPAYDARKCLDFLDFSRPIESKRQYEYSAVRQVWNGTVNPNYTSASIPWGQITAWRQWRMDQGSPFGKLKLGVPYLPYPRHEDCETYLPTLDASRIISEAKTAEGVFTSPETTLTRLGIYKAYNILVHESTFPWAPEECARFVIYHDFNKDLHMVADYAAFAPNHTRYSEAQVPVNAILEWKVFKKEIPHAYGKGRSASAAVSLQDEDFFPSFKNSSYYRDYILPQASNTGSHAQQAQNPYRMQSSQVGSSFEYPIPLTGSSPTPGLLAMAAPPQLSQNSGPSQDSQRRLPEKRDPCSEGQIDKLIKSFK